MALGTSCNQQRISGELEKNASFCGKNEFQLLFYAVQVALQYCISKMVKSMHQDSIALEEELEIQGRPNLFKSTPVVTSKELDLLQTLHMYTLLYTQVRRGAGDRWKNGYKCVQVLETCGRISAGMWSP